MDENLEIIGWLFAGSAVIVIALIIFIIKRLDT